MKKIIVVLIFLAVFSSLVFAKCGDFDGLHCPATSDGETCCVNYNKECIQGQGSCISLSEASQPAKQCEGHCYYRRPFKCTDEKQICRIDCENYYNDNNPYGTIGSCHPDCDYKERR